MPDKGTRHERALKAVEEIGPAVFNGGFTTFLALALLGFSTSQIFLTFFKVIKDSPEVKKKFFVHNLFSDSAWGRGGGIGNGGISVLTGCLIQERRLDGEPINYKLRRRPLHFELLPNYKMVIFST